MPDEQVAAPEQPIAQPAAPAASAKSDETFFQKMERLGGFDAEPPAEAEAPPAPAAEAAPAAKEEPKADKKPKAKGKKDAKAPEAAAEAAPVVEVAPPTPEQKAETLKLLAKELGMVVEDGKVLTSDRAALRIAKKEADQRLREQEQTLVAKYNEAVSAFTPELERARAINKALDDGDADELAKFANAKDWNEVQERFIAKLTDPNWKKIRDLERQVEADKKTKADAEEKLRQQSEHNKQLEAQRNYRANLSAQLKKSTEPLCREMAEDPIFVNTIFQIQKENWDGETTVTAEQAVKMMVKGAPLALQDELRKNYERLHKVFGQAPAAADVTAPAVAQAAAVIATPTVSTDKPGQRPRPKTQVAPAATGGAPSPPAQFKTAAERRAYTARRLAEAAEDDRRNSA